jgi:hypothetical protein
MDKCVDQMQSGIYNIFEVIIYMIGTRGVKALIPPAALFSSFSSRSVRSSPTTVKMFILKGPGFHACG